jgi:dolichol-phosphate mannosyltransferase
MIYVLLPAYNEEDAIEPLAAKIDRTMRSRGWAYRIVVVNDGSRDRTSEMLETVSARYPLHVVTHKYNRGLGETARDGFEYIAEVASPEDVVVRMDCDDTHDPEYIPAMMAKLDDGYEVVIASRYQRGGGEVGLDWYRRLISRIANLLFKFVFPIPRVWEYTCGFRAYRVALIQDALTIFGNKFIDLKGLGFTGTLEKLIKLRMLGARVAEIPFVLRYDQKLSSSKVVTSITTLGCFILIFKHFRFWAEEGWKRQIAERRARVYGAGSRRIDLEGVRTFWNRHPFFVGEAVTAPGERAFFEEHRQFADEEHSGALYPMYTRDVEEGSLVLDVGCGIGFWVHEFCRLGAKVSACDLSDAAVDITRRRLALYGLTADVRWGNAEELPYPKESFDHVNCQGVIHHTPDAARCVMEFYRVLRPGGTLCLSVYYKAWYLRSSLRFRLLVAVLRPWVGLRGRGREGMFAAPTAEEFVRLYDGADNPIGRAYTRRELRNLLAGRFTILEERRHGIPRRALPIAIPDSLHRFLSSRFGLGLVVRCQRLDDHHNEGP